MEHFTKMNVISYVFSEKKKIVLMHDNTFYMKYTVTTNICTRMCVNNKCHAKCYTIYYALAYEEFLNREGLKINTHSVDTRLRFKNKMGVLFIVLAVVTTVITTVYL